LLHLPRNNRVIEKEGSRIAFAECGRALERCFPLAGVSAIFLSEFLIQTIEVYNCMVTICFQPVIGYRRDIVKVAETGYLQT